jgi:two-component sensor histidine kinase
MHLTDETFAAVTDLTDAGLCHCEIITDSDGQPIDYRFLKVNSRFAEYTGLENAEGKTAMELVPHLEKRWVEAYARVGLGRETLQFEAGSDPMGRWFEVYSTPLEPHGHLAIVFRDISGRKRAEHQREQALEQAHRLFEELGHRVKNSLAVISSIIAMETRSAPEVAQDALRRLATRITAIGKLYEKLDSVDGLERAEISHYLREITKELHSSQVDAARVQVETDLDEVYLPSNMAVKLGLIVNELMTNSIKHAFVCEEQGIIRVELKRNESSLRLSVSDNGTAKDRAQRGGRTGLGTKLVNAFVMDLGGRLEKVDRARGTRTDVIMPLSAEQDSAPGIGG